ncbi:MAG: YbaN family protein [Pseudomonadota bacterium]
MTRAIWTFLGFIALSLGAIGVVLPVLPTTPFVLLAVFAFAKGSPRLEAWLRGHRVFGPIILEWDTKGAIAPRYKTIAIAMMAGAFAASVILDLSQTVLVIQAVCILGAAAFILSRPNG